MRQRGGTRGGNPDSVGNLRIGLVARVPFPPHQPDAPVLMLRCVFSAPKGHGKIARGFQPLVPECERGPGAGSSWLLTIAPVGARKPRNIKTRQRRCAGNRQCNAPTRPVGRAFDRCRFLAAAQAITARKLRQCEKSQADETAERREGFRLHDTAGDRKLLEHRLVFHQRAVQGP